MSDFCHNCAQLERQLADVISQRDRWSAKFRALNDQRPELPPRVAASDALMAIADFCNEPMECGHNVECWDETREVCVWCEAVRLRAALAEPTKETDNG